MAEPDESESNPADHDDDDEAANENMVRGHNAKPNRGCIGWCHCT
jgi:hypothetical protein